MRARWWWLVAAMSVLFFAAQAGVAALVWSHTRPRLPPLAAATPALDQAIAAVVAAVGDDAAVTVSGLVPTAACQRGPLAKGHRYTRTADLYPSAGGEQALVDRIAAALPAGDHPQRGARIGGHAAPLTAGLPGDASLQVVQIDQGWVAATAQTGCRTGSSAASGGQLPEDAVSAVTRLLGTLNTTPESWHSDAVSCPGRQIMTVDAVSRTTATDGLAARLAPAVPAGARTFASPSNRLAWRDGTTSVIVAASDDGTHITVQRTTGC